MIAANPRYGKVSGQALLELPMWVVPRE